jgi:hypothetical protein
MQTEFAAWVAIDWADQNPAWALEIPGSSNRESGSGLVPIFETNG